MKILILLMLFTIQSNTADKCATITECLKLLCKDEVAIKYLHPEVKGRLPYKFLTVENCDIKSDLFTIVTVDSIQQNLESITKKSNSELHVLKFEDSGKLIQIHLFYPTEGAGFKCTLIRKENVITVSEVSIYEI